MKPRKIRFNRFILVMIIILFCTPNFLITPVKGAENDQIKHMEYLFEFNFENADEKMKFKTTIRLEINHTNYEFPGNGTIKYYVEDLIADPLLLLMLSDVLPSEFINFLHNHEQDEYFQTYYTNRTESTSPTFNTSNSYLPFWMHESMEEITNFVNFGRVYFFNTSDPYSLAIDDIVTISHGSKLWSDSFGGRLFHTHLVTCFILSLDIIIGDDEIFAHLYYDRANGMLMFGHIYFKQVIETEKTVVELKLYHITSTFSITEKFNIWLIGTISVFIIAGCLIGWIGYTIIRNEKIRKPSRLDQI
ncbi:MAG: hypothetical protein ACTSRE_14800 [Promethearchaeota archaeon]